MSSIGDGASDMTSVLGLNSFGGCKLLMFKTCSGSLPIHPRRYELLQGFFRSGDLSLTPSHAEVHNARDTTHLYKVTMREDTMEFGDLLASFRAPT